MFTFFSEVKIEHGLGPTMVESLFMFIVCHADLYLCIVASELSVFFL